MPQRQQITLGSSSSQADGEHPLRVTLARPDGSATGRALVVINRGLAASEVEVDFIEALADGLADAGVVAVRYEPRTSGLILDDLHAVSFEDEVADLARVVAYAAKTPGIDASRTTLVACWLGSAAALEAAGQQPAIGRVALVFPEVPGPPGSASHEALPRAFVAGADFRTWSELARRSNQPVSIIHAGAGQFDSDEGLALLAACRDIARPADRVVIARADRAFSLPDVRSACIEQIAALANAAASAPRPGRATAGAVA